MPRETRCTAGDELYRGRQDVPQETRHTVEGRSEAEGTVKQSGVRGFPLQQVHKVHPKFFFSLFLLT